MARLRWFIILLIAVSLGAGAVFAQMGRGGRGGRGSRGGGRDRGGGMGGGGRGAQVYSDREISSRSNMFEWEIDEEFSSDIFTFVRVIYSSTGGSSPNRNATYSKWFNDPAVTGRGPFREGWRWGSGANWRIDYPDSDYNFVFRLHQLTSIEVNPRPIALELTNPDLSSYPFLYLCAPGYLGFNEAEVKALRSYLLNGGFLMMDDFWGDNEWENVYNQMKRVFPEREPMELMLEHPIFNCVFVLKKKPQVLNYRYAEMGREYGITWERPDARNPHYMALYDDKGRMMVLMCLNTDTGDGWEREGDNEWFFHEFSESQAYPLGINIVFYAMTH